MPLSFVTTNKHKFQEVAEIFSKYDLEIKQLDMEYAENHDESLEEIASNAAKDLAEKLDEPIILEDTGLFFEAFEGFPGALPKFVFNTLGYKGIMKLLAGESRGAYFKTVAAYCEPGAEPQLFEGTMRGVITEKVFDEDKDFMPYDRIFIPAGHDVTISRMSMTEKNSLSQRAEAFRQMAERIKNNQAG